MAFTEDLDPLFADFAVAATVGAATVSGIFDRGFINQLTGLAGGVGGGLPALLVKSADVSTNSITRNTAIVISGTTYYVEDLQADGTGLTLLVLTLEQLP